MIVVFGSVNLDLVARGARMPRPGETVSGDSFAMFPGGKGANQALAARRAGAAVRMFGAVGRDAFADPALAFLAQSGVDLSGVRRVDAPTGVALINVDANGENAITVVAGANAAADPDRIPDEALLAGPTLMLQLEVPLPAVAAIVRRASAAGARVVLNAAPAAPLAADVLALLDVIIVNEHEAAALAPQLQVAPAAEAFALAMQQRYDCATVVTLGGAGAFVVAGGNRHSAPAPRTEVVDTTAAGDAFCGALAAALDRGAGWPRALAEGIAAGSLACRRAGAQPSLPEAAAIAELAKVVEATVTTIAVSAN
jgi:ribokinase